MSQWAQAGCKPFGYEAMYRSIGKIFRSALKHLLSAASARKATSGIGWRVSEDVAGSSVTECQLSSFFRQGS